MPVKKIKPTTPGQRFRIANDFSGLTKKKPEKRLLYTVKKTGGRNNTGKITVHHRGGGHKRRGRLVDFKRSKYGVPGIVKSLEYDPIRTAFIMLVAYKDGEKNYLIAPKGIQAGDQVVSGEEVAPDLGNAMPLCNIPVGTVVHNVELSPGRGGAMARSAGSYAQLVAKPKEGKNVILKLPSGERRLVNKNCMATVGVVSNPEHRNLILGKAGRNRWLGVRPTVRGTVKNPVDHPNGGGEGKNKGRQLTSKNGIPKGKKTRNRKKCSTRMIVKRRN
jgi:large subunit ribosomal protein L2